MDNNSKITCRLCNVGTRTGIGIYGTQGEKLSMERILTQHFDLQFHEHDNFSKIICKKCWKVTDKFHSLYCTVKEIETELKLNQNKSVSPSTMNSENIKSVPLDDQSTDIKIEIITNNDKNDEMLISRNIRTDEEKSVKLEKGQIKKILKKQQIVRTNKKVQSVKITKVTARNFVGKEQVMLQEGKINSEVEMICEICNEKSSSFQKLKTHIRLLHNMTGFIRCCGIKYFRRGRLYAHISDHNSFGKYKCEKCDKIFVDKIRLDEHVYIHDPASKKSECKKCFKKFLSPSALTDHMLSVHRTSDTIKSFVCDICGKAFTTKKWLTSHIVYSHTTKYSQMCDICAQVFHSRKLLDDHHKKKHMGIPLPKHQCTICGSWLSTHSGLKEHMQVHNAKKESCHICGKITINLIALKNHMRYEHSGRIFQCQICQKILKSPISLKEHIASHTGISLYKCSYCPMEFNSNGNMSKHKRNIHSVEYQQDRDKKLKYSNNI